MWRLNLPLRAVSDNHHETGKEGEEENTYTCNINCRHPPLGIFQAEYIPLPGPSSPYYALPVTRANPHLYQGARQVRFRRPIRQTRRKRKLAKNQQKFQNRFKRPRKLVTRRPKLNFISTNKRPILRKQKFKRKPRVFKNSPKYQFKSRNILQRSKLGRYLSKPRNKYFRFI